MVHFLDDKKFKLLYEGKYINVVKKDNQEYVNRNTNTGEVVSILPITANNEVILIEQFRTPVGCNVIECPAGVVGDVEKQELPISCAFKELLEETGYISNNWELVSTSPQSPGITSEINHKFIASDCELYGIKEENIIVHLIKLDNINYWLEKKEKEKDILVSAGIYAGLYLL